MLEIIVTLYRILFARVRFQRLNKLLFRLSLSGLGILNHKSSNASGEKSFLKTYLSKNAGTVIDVGANIGNYTLNALNVNPALKIYAFEPHPITYSSLFQNVSSHKNVFSINKGMSSKNGTLKLYDYPYNDGSSHASLFQDVITEIHRAGTSISHEVDLITLDEFIEGEEIEEIVLLKIDTEGNELEILKGGVRALSQKKIKAIHFEFNEMNVSSRAFFRDFWKLLEGYRLYRLLPNEMLEIKSYNPLGCELFAYQNIVAILKD